MSQTPIQQLKIGVLGGGQLGKMLSVAASPWSLDIELMDSEKGALDKGVASTLAVGDLNSYDEIVAFGKNKDVVTIEKEDVDVEALQSLKDSGVKVCPDPDSLRIIQDKYKQKLFYHEKGFPTPEFYNISKSDLIQKVSSGEQSLPFVLKHRTSGYDGKGVAIIKEASALESLEEKDYLVEEFVSIQKELSIIAARNGNGDIELYDITEPVADPSGFLMTSLKAPADVTDSLKSELELVSKQLVAEFKIEGLLAIEYIIDNDNKYYINEVSPRPHNTGHHTIEYNTVSQFEQHWRGVLNLPLGKNTHKGCSICINVLGPREGSGAPRYEGISALLAEEGIHLHLYGKKESKPNRKLGHITVVADDETDLKRKVEIVEKEFRVKV